MCWALCIGPPPNSSLPTLADGGYDGAGIGVHTPVKQPTGDQVLDADNRAYNALLRGLRCLGERGFALLTGRWRTLRHITASPRKIGDIVKAALVLTHFEHGKIRLKVVEITSLSGVVSISATTGASKLPITEPDSGALDAQGSSAEFIN